MRGSVCDRIFLPSLRKVRMRDTLIFRGSPRTDAITGFLSNISPGFRSGEDGPCLYVPINERVAHNINFESWSDVNDVENLILNGIAAIALKREAEKVLSRKMKQIQVSFENVERPSEILVSNEKKYILAALFISLEPEDCNKQVEIVNGKLRDWQQFNPNTFVVLYTNVPEKFPALTCVSTDALGMPDFLANSFLYDIVDFAKIKMLRHVMKTPYACYTIIDSFNMVPISIEEQFAKVHERGMFAFGKGNGLLENWVYMCTSNHKQKVNDFEEYTTKLVTNYKDKLQTSNLFVSDFIVEVFPDWIMKDENIEYLNQQFGRIFESSTMYKPQNAPRAETLTERLLRKILNSSPSQRQGSEG